jgi:uncharacterized protein
VPLLTPRDAPIGFDENTHPVAREFAEFYSTPRGYHPNSITQWTTTSSLSLMNFPLLTNIEWISPRPILFITGEHAHSRYYSEDAYERAAEPKELYVVPNAGHVDLYDKTDLIPFDKLEEFFTKNLAPRRATPYGNSSVPGPDPLSGRRGPRRPHSPHARASHSAESNRA